MAMAAVERASVALGREGNVGRWSAIQRSYVQRDWWQVQHATTLFAVGFAASATGNPSSVGVQGGTAWACQMFLERWCSQERDSEKRVNWWSWKPAPLFFFFMHKNGGDGITGWSQVEVKSSCAGQLTNVRWRSIESPPPPQGGYCGIGSREINEDGRQAVIHLFEGISG